MIKFLLVEIYFVGDMFLDLNKLAIVVGMILADLHKKNNKLSPMKVLKRILYNF